MPNLENRTLIVLVILVSLAFGWIVLPFFGAILWGVVIAVVFAPMHEALLAKMPRRENSAALLTLLAIIAIVIIPAILLFLLLLNEATTIYGLIRAGQVDFGLYFEQIQRLLPDWAMGLLERAGLDNFDAVRDRVSAGFANSFQALAGQAFNIGQSAFGFFVALTIMLYLTFFLLRDGERLAVIIEQAIPLHQEQRARLLEKFIMVIRATIKGSLVVAIVQGLIGGTVFWVLGIQGALLWGVAMAFLSLLPAIGTGLIWVPVAIYLFATGSLWEGSILAFCGVFIIGMVDNILRPILVGRDVRMPDYIVLISTLGGLELMGFNGIFIGPLIAAVFMASWSIFTEARKGKSAETLVVSE